jgi:RimJ/RimL family protein N-acetyltransferase
MSVAKYIPNEPSVTVRVATADDCLLFWHWANDPEVRSRSFSPEPIPLDAHRLWFEDKLASASCVMLVGLDAFGTAMGQVRLDLTNDTEGQTAAIISISLADKYRGQGLGTQLLRAAVAAATEQLGNVKFIGYVLTDNGNSRKMFEKSGFLLSGNAVFKDRECVCYLWPGAG